MINALFLGSLPHLQLAFPPLFRSEIARRARILGEDSEGEDWEKIANRLAEADMIFSTWGMPEMNGKFLAAAPGLKAVFYAAGSIKCFAKPEAYDRGIVISSAWAANAVPVAEYTVATILLSLKRFWAYSEQTKSPQTFRRKLTVPGGFGSKVGLISLGAIGKLVARKLGSFDLNLLGYDPFADDEIAQDLGISLLGLEEVFSTSDVVSIHTPWLPETENMIDGRLVRSMKEGATLINTSRGAVINEAELCAALAERPDLTAVLDVTYPEPPLESSPLYSLPNVILTPHIAGSMDGEISRMGRWMTDEFFRYMDGQPLKHAVSREALARMA